MKRFFYCFCTLVVFAGTVVGQEFRIFDRTVQVHGFVQQGFAYTDNNNFLTMKTSNGAGFTDGGINLSTAVTDKLRVGAQAYTRNIGAIGNFNIQLDWAYGDYKFKPWFGVRAGKVKTAIGLYNDIQDTDALFTWALLPQAVYPADLRSNFISHTGGDVYGKIGLNKAGSLDYVAYYGQRSFESSSGFRLYAVDRGIPMKSQTGKAMGSDLRWNTPLRGVMVGGSFMRLTEHRIGDFPAMNKMRYDSYARPDKIWAAYGDYLHNKWHFNGEWRREQYDLFSNFNFAKTFSKMPKGNDGWFMSGAYRINKVAEVGSYYSRYTLYYPYGASAKDPEANHIYDKVVTLRLDLNRWWTVKIEEHAMEGYADPYSPHGFYTRVNPQMKPDTNMLVLKTGWSF